MKKLFALVALVGMGFFIAGCAEESKGPPAKSPTGGAGGVSTGPKAGDATEKATTGDADKEMPADGDAKSDDGDAKTDTDSKPDGDEKPDSEDKPTE
jgi:hypothetical protein